MDKIRPVVRTLGPWLCACFLNVVIFVPALVFSQPKATFIPSLAAVHGSLAKLIFDRDNQDIFRISLDVVLLVSLAILSAPTRARAVVRALLVASYLWLFVFLSYHQGVSFFFERAPALGQDWRMLLNLGHFLASVWSLRWAVYLSICAVALVLMTVTAWYAFHGIQRATGDWSLRKRALVVAGMIAPCIVFLAVVGVSRDAPLVQVTSKRLLYNFRNSQKEAARLAELEDREPDRRYDPYLQLELRTKPNFYLMMVEAYGEVLATWDAAPAYRALMQRVEARLKAAGYSARTTYSASPVHSGGSWFAISTVHTGALIDRPLVYDALELVGARVPSLTRFFDAHGYRTYTLQPGTTDHAGLRRFDLFNHDVVIDGRPLHYRGAKYGWGKIPDQWSWWQFMHHDGWFKERTEPYYVYSMCVSTHWSWERVPPYVNDVHVFEDPNADPKADPDPRWPPIPEVANIASDTRRRYFASVEYEWRVMLDVLEADKSPNIVVAIVGDHQPRLEADVPGGVTMNTPLHMLSRDPGFIDSLADSGFQPGMYADPKAAKPLWHEGLFSLWVSKLVARYGAPGAPQVPVFPHGIRLSTLTR